MIYYKKRSLQYLRGEVEIDKNRNRRNCGFIDERLKDLENKDEC